LKVYADSSFVFAPYLQQPCSAAAIALMQRQGEPLPFTSWHRLKVRNAIRLAIFHRLIDFFLTFDERQRKVAQAAGLSVKF
jgi:hypothetical protein